MKEYDTYLRITTMHYLSIEIRAGEEYQLRTAAFLQSITATITPMINIFASIAVFLAFT